MGRGAGLGQEGDVLCFFLFLSGAAGFRNHTLVSQPIIPQSQTRDPLSWRSGAGDGPSGRCREALVCEAGEPEGSRSKTNPKGRAQVPGGLILSAGERTIRKGH